MINVNKNGQWSLIGTDLKKYNEETDTLKKATSHLTPPQKRNLEQDLTNSSPVSDSLDPHHHAEGSVHPQDHSDKGYGNRLPRLAHKTKMKNKDGSPLMAWQNHPLTTKKQETKIAEFLGTEGAQKQLGLSDEGWKHFGTLVKHISSDPDKGVMKGGTSKNSKGMPNELRTRHILKMLNPNDPHLHVMQNDDGTLNMHAGERHGSRDKATRWHFDGKTLKSTLINDKNEETHGSINIETESGQKGGKPKMTKKQQREAKKAKGDIARETSMKQPKAKKHKGKLNKSIEELEAEELLMKAELESDLDTLEKFAKEDLLKSGDPTPIELTPSLIDKLMGFK